LHSRFFELDMDAPNNDNSLSMARTTPRNTHTADPGGTPIADIVADALPVTSLPLRKWLLQRLLLPVGPLALTVLAGGAFAKYAQFARDLAIPVTLDDAARVTSNQLVEIARYLEQSDPAVLDQVIAAIVREPTAMAALSASVAAVAMSIAARAANRKP
jgi:hypothetical protein